MVVGSEGVFGVQVLPRKIAREAAARAPERPQQAKMAGLKTPYRAIT
jgi:hypothetical protein